MPFEDVSDAGSATISASTADATEVVSGTANADSTSGCLLERSAGKSITREILIFRRLEPGQLRSSENLSLPESPFVEAKIATLALNEKDLELLRAGDTMRNNEVLAVHNRYGHWLALALTAGFGIAACAWLRFLPVTWCAPALILGVVSLLALVGLRWHLDRKSAARVSAWLATRDGKAWDELQKDLRQAWLQRSAGFREAGWHTEIRLAEGSGQPARLRSIGVGVTDDGAPFCAEDFAPSADQAVAPDAIAYCFVQAQQVERVWLNRAQFAL